MNAQITIKMDNAAFDGATGEELSRILHGFADKAAHWPGTHSFKIGAFDMNGNRVGAFEVAL